jgi:hypothetical protein
MTAQLHRRPYDAIDSRDARIARWKQPARDRVDGEVSRCGSGDLGRTTQRSSATKRACDLGLVAFIARDDIPVLGRGPAHAQFETIHPFDGKAHRAGTGACRSDTRDSRNVTVPVSAGLLKDVDACSTP